MTSESAAGQLLHVMTLLAFILHIAGGAIGLVSGTVAVFVRKGGALHRKAGAIFVASMLVMGTFAVYLAMAEPDQITNVFIGTLAVYLVSGLAHPDPIRLPPSFVSAEWGRRSPVYLSPASEFAGATRFRKRQCPFSRISESSYRPASAITGFLST
jgi:hypothetical protein